MKKVLLSMLFFAIFSCSNEKNEQIVQEVEQDESTMEALERQGITLYKKQIKVTDETGQNSVDLLLASRSQRALNEYLKMTDIKLEVSSVPGKTRMESKNDPATDPIGGSEMVFMPAENDVFDEVVGKNMVDGVKQYSIKYSFLGQNLRITDISYSQINWHESQKFDDWMRVARGIAPDTDENSIFVDWYYKNCALCGFSSGPDVTLRGDGEGYLYYRDARFLACYVRHNYGNYTVTRGNW
jgi:hypothetical protein